MTGYLRAARVCRAVAVLAATVTVWLALTAPWWTAALTGWAAFLAFAMGRLLNLGHNSLITDPRRKETSTR